MAERMATAAGGGKKTLNTAYKGYKDGSVDFLGDQVEALTGYTKEQFNGKQIKWTELILAEDLPRCREAFVQALKGDKTYMREYRIRSRGDSLIWIQEWSQIICNELGEVEYVTGILMDITAQKRDEMARRQCEQRTGKYLTFFLAGQEFGLGIAKVKEILPLMTITAVPQAPHYLPGVINLRGKVIPVVDLRLKLDLEPQDGTNRTCIIVVEAGNAGDLRMTGIIVDGVSEVTQINGADIEEPPAFIAGLAAQNLYGLAKIGQSVKILLDVDRVLGDMTLAPQLWNTDPVTSEPTVVSASS